MQEDSKEKLLNILKGMDSSKIHLEFERELKPNHHLEATISFTWVENKNNEKSN